MKIFLQTLAATKFNSGTPQITKARQDFEYPNKFGSLPLEKEQVVSIIHPPQVVSKIHSPSPKHICNTPLLLTGVRDKCHNPTKPSLRNNKDKMDGSNNGINSLSNFVTHNKNCNYPKQDSVIKDIS